MFVGMLLIVLIAGLAALPLMITPDFVGEQLQAAVKKATGRTLQISAPPKLSYWPELAVELNGVALSNPPGMAEGNVAQMNKLRVRVAALPLLSRRVEIKEITLVQPRLNLVMTGNGQANWAFEQAGGNGSSAGSGTTEQCSGLRRGRVDCAGQYRRWHHQVSG